MTSSVAIVTGGASGIGAALARQLAARGAHVCIADINARLLAETAGDMKAAGHNVESRVVDVRDAAAVQTLVDDIHGRHGRIDWMFNNAGIAIGGDAVDMTLDDWTRTLDVNVRGVVHGVVAVYPKMIAQGFGHIVNTASVAGLSPSPGLTAYSASKHAVVGLSTSLALEAKAHGVRVTAVCPGLIETPLMQTAELRGGVRSEQVLNDIPLRAYPADRCARDILRGVDRGDTVVVVTQHGKAIHRLYRFVPRTYARLTGFVMGRALARYRRDA